MYARKQLVYPASPRYRLYRFVALKTRLESGIFKILAANGHKRFAVRSRLAYHYRSRKMFISHCKAAMVR
jgi:hypothetical protein